MIKRNLFKIVFLGTIAILFLLLGQSLLADEEYICAVYFTGVGCPHCANADSVILEDLPREYPNFVVIEYEIYQQRENAPLLYEYNENYNSGLGIPLIIFNKKDYMVGDRSILSKTKPIIEKGSNKCPLIDGSSTN
ncbi:unnamed protein product, partial [marine sediment metagenome]